MDINLIPQETTILVVDDTPTNLQVLFDLLNQEGYRVASAKDGSTALARVESFTPDLILLDIMMPEMDGFETCCQLKTNPATQDIPIIFMTALSDPIDKVQGLSLGAVDYITKPIQHEEVLARIQVHLKLRHLSRTLERRMADRTNELNLALEKLKQPQVSPVQSEKTGLDQLVADVTQELNKPISLIHGNVEQIDDSIKKLIAMLQLYQQECPEPSPAIQAKAKHLELDSIIENTSNAISSVHLSTDQIKQLVLSMGNSSPLK